MIDCPLCGRTLTEPAAECPACRGDLRSLAQIAALADEHFNKAVAAARALRWDSAAEHLAVTRALSPGDVDAIVLLAKVRHRQRGGQRAEEVRRLLRRAQELAPDREDVGSALEEAARPRHRRRQRRSKRRR